MQGSFGEFYNVLFRFLRFAQVAERIKESRSKSGCYLVEEDAAARSELRSQARQPRVEFTFFNLYLLADVRGASHPSAILTTRNDDTKHRVSRCRERQRKRHYLSVARDRPRY